MDCKGCFSGSNTAGHLFDCPTRIKYLENRIQELEAETRRYQTWAKDAEAQRDAMAIRIRTLRGALASVATIKSEGWIGTYVGTLQNRLDKIIAHCEAATKL